MWSRLAASPMRDGYSADTPPWSLLISDLCKLLEQRASGFMRYFGAFFVRLMQLRGSRHGIVFCSEAHLSKMSRNFKIKRLWECPEPMTDVVLLVSHLCIVRRFLATGVLCLLLWLLSATFPITSVPHSSQEYDVLSWILVWWMRRRTSSVKLLPH